MAPRGRITIKDVAAAAGVSLTTVSDSLTGKGRIPEATRRRVRQVADQLGYRPNALARQLRGEGLGLIGFVISPAAEATMTTVWYWSELMSHVAEAALGQRHAVVLLPYDAELLSSMPLPVDGAIVVDPRRSDAVVAALRATGMPVVTVGRDGDQPIEPWVDDDNAGGVEQLLTTTVRPGERLALITLEPAKSHVADTITATRAWAEHHRSALEVHTVASFSPETLDPVLDAVCGGFGADAVLVQNDRLAVALLPRLRARGVAVPGSVRLICACDAPELERVRPSVTAVRHHPEQVASLAVRSVIDAIAGRPPAGRALVPMELIVRKSAPSIGRSTRRRPNRPG